MIMKIKQRRKIEIHNAVFLLVFQKNNSGKQKFRNIFQRKSIMKTCSKK